MGIKYLNKYLMQNCKNKSIEKKHLSYLSGKKIVIDTSIYLYKYQAQNALQENFYHMISLFRKYNIHPLFVFDGKPPIEKMDALNDADALLLITEWKQFRNPDWSAVENRLKNPIVYDGRNIYEPAKVLEHGFEYYGIGRRSI